MSKCIKCGERVCRQKAMYYAAPLNQYCSECIREAVKKLAKEKE